MDIRDFKEKKMKVNILYLYYDLLNLYGENGNIRILEKHLSDQGFYVNIDKKSVDDNIEFKNYDFIYMGSGTEFRQKTALKHLFQYKDEIKNAVEEGVVFLLTGNSFEMLGKEIISGSGDTYECLNLLEFTTKENSFDRETGDIVAKFDYITSPIVGYINKCSEISDVDSPFCKALLGKGNKRQSKFEGVRINNLFGTHIIGPILAKNPEFLDYMIKLILSKYEGFVYKKIDYIYEVQAYEITLNQL